MPQNQTDTTEERDGSALSGLRVLEVADGISGSYCGRLLADVGADVIKVEPPDGGSLRREGPFPGDVPDLERSGMFHYLNAGKRSVVIDLVTKSGMGKLLRLAQEADVLITSYEPEKLRSLTMTYQRLRRANSRLIVTMITPFGFRSPYQGWKTNEFTLWHMSGLGFGTPGTPDRVKDPEREPPLHPQAPTGDILVGGAACAATMCALHARYADGQGRLVDIPAQAALATFTLADVMVYSYAHILRGRHPVGHMGIPNDLFPCQDGWVIIAAPTPAQWESLVEVMGRPAWASGEGFQTSQGRASLQGELTQRIQEWTLSLTGEEITRLCQAKGVPSFHYHGVPQVVTSDHLAARNAFRQLDIGGCSALAPGTLVGVKGGCTPRRRRGPHLGEHTSEVLAAVAREKTSGTRSSIDQGQPLSQTRLPLAGIRVVDLTQFIAGPYTGQLLGWMGAEVILVESRSRPRAPAAGSTLDSVTRASVDFVQTNKRAVTLDLKHPEGLSLLKELVQVSDVVIDNFSTGVMERLGLGYDTLRALRPDIVMLSMGAFGRTGPLRDARGFNSGVNLFSGVAAATGYPDGRPRLLGCFLPDTWAGFCAFLAILGALYHRKRTGQGQYIDYSMAEACLQLAPNIFIDFTLNEREPAFLGNRDPLRAPQGVYRCRGWDAWVAASVSTDGEWRRLCEALGRRDLADDSRFATSQGRRDHHDEIDSHIGRWAKLHTARQAAELLQGAGVTAGPVLNTKDVLNEPHLKARRTVAYVDHPEVGRKRLVAIPWRIGGLAPIRYRHAPDVGQDNDFVFQEVLGLTEPEMSHREKTGALS